MISRRKALGLTAAFSSAFSLAKVFAATGSPARAAEAAALQKKLGDKLTLKGATGYEELRQYLIFNARKPKRYPEGIVMAESIDDVVAAVKLAKARGWQVGTRSGGHSWSASHTRDRALLISLANLEEIKVEPETMTAVCSPSTTGDGLNIVLQDKYKLMFPSAHGVGVGVGGFVMQGGHGWNARNWGPGCANLKALDLVTADGELIHADEKTNSDYLWAARGGGPGFFGVAVRYYLQVHPDPPVKERSSFTFPVEVLPELVTWVRDNCDGWLKALEVVMIGRQIDGVPRVIINGTVLGTRQEVDAGLAIMESMPFKAKALSSKLRQKAEVPGRFEPPTEGLPAGYRFAIDNIWTSSPSAQIAPLMHELFTNYPTPKSYIFWQCWGPVHKLHDMAYSVQGDIYIAANAVYEDAADDARCDAWAKAAMARLESISLGSQMNDENMALRASRYLSPQASAKLARLRAKYDPEHRFVGFLNKA
jgi:FAD/FMN-containing dehydrogenase